MRRLNVVRVQMVKDHTVSYDAERITAPEQAARAFRALVGESDREVCCAVMLDGKNRPVCIHQVSMGSLNQSIVHPREVFKAAILANAAAIILVHNHPSGDTLPSSEDREITRRIKEAGDLLGIRLMDHVIVVDGDYLSFAESGLL